MLAYKVPENSANNLLHSARILLGEMRADMIQAEQKDSPRGWGDSPSQLRFAHCASSPPPASLREEQKATLVSPWRDAKGEHVFSFFPLGI